MSSIREFNTLKKTFQEKLESTLNQKFLIDREILAIETFLLNQQRHQTGTIPSSAFKPVGSVLDIDSIPYIRYRDFVSVCENFILEGTAGIEESQMSSTLFPAEKKEVILQAQELADYYKWLKGLVSSEKITPKKQSNLSHKQKMLALYYLGLDLSKFDNSKSAKILSDILELNEENTRKYLSYLAAGKNEVRTKNNLAKLNQIFKNQGFIDISTAIESDLEKL